MSHRIISLVTSLVFAGSLIVCSPVASWASPPIEIRLTVAAFNFESDGVSNTDFVSRNESAAFDVVWQGQVFNTVFQTNGPKVLFAQGSTNYKTASGNGNCTGTLSLAPANQHFIPKISDNNGTVKMNITLPHSTNYAPPQAFLMDASQPEFSQCRTAHFSIGSCIGIPGNCISGDVMPKFDGPGGPTPLGYLGDYLTKVYFEFSDNSPNFSTGFTYKMENDLPISSFKRKVVWVGFLSISTNISSGTPSPVNPFDVFSIEPPDVGNPPKDPTPPTGDPHKKPTEEVDVTVLNSWMKTVQNKIKKFIKQIQGKGGTTAAAPVLPAIVNINGAGVVGSYNDGNGIASLPGQVLNPAPNSGVLQVRVKLKPKSTKTKKINVLKKNIQNEMSSGSSSGLTFELDKSARKSIAKGAAKKAFLALKFTPDNGADPVTIQKSFNLRKRKK
ncbi:MAG: hypothetical protein KDD53_00305 [Bdellovibrionales bacterium]|nr:hypothetical protein [Bdellovibrionales bacterium]